MTEELSYACSVDIGGTFTDCTLADSDGRVVTSKARSTPETDFQRGFFDSIRRAASKMSEDIDSLMSKLVRLTHGTTVATNAVVEKEGAKVGVLTTVGHEDTLTMMRGRGRVSGEPPENLLRVAEMRRPDPVVPRNLVEGVTERVDHEGSVVVPMDESELETAVDDLLAQDVDGIAVSFLWSFKNPKHEKRAAEIIRDRADGDFFVSLSHQISPTMGEYERTVATAINTIVGPLVEDYIEDIEQRLRQEFDFDGTFLLMGANGGCFTPAQASKNPIMMIGSGPVGGLKGCQHEVSEMQEVENVLATDMGGTSFELGVLSDGRPLVQNTSLVQKYAYNIPKLDVESIAAGGGSIADVEEERITVGPESVGAHPGPACYNRGGRVPTVTDANMYLGYINPEATFGTDEIQPSADKAEEVLEDVGAALELGPQEFAASVFEIANTKMANLIEKNVIGRGYDPRDFHVISYGGAGPLHASSYAKELDARSIVVPGEISPVWSAYGILNTDIRQEFTEEVVFLEPLDFGDIENKLAQLEETGRDKLAAEGIDSDDVRFDRYALMRYEGQKHEVEVPINDSVTTADDMIERYNNEYRQRYSDAATFPEGRVEIESFRVEPIVPVEKYERATEELDGRVPETARKGQRDVYWPSIDSREATDVYSGQDLRPGNEIQGPTVIDMPNTGIVVRDGQKVTMNEFRDFVIETEG